MQYHNSCRMEMPHWANKTIKYNPGEKSLKEPFSCFLDLECTFKKLQSSQNNPEKSYTEEKARHEPSGWVYIQNVHLIKKKINLITIEKQIVLKNYKSLKEQAGKIINNEKKEMILLIKEENNFYNEQEICFICKEKFCMFKDDQNYTNVKRLKIIVIIQDNLEGLHII